MGVRVQQPRPKMWRYTSKMRQRPYNNQVLRRGCGVHAVSSSDAAVCATSRDVAVHTTVSKDRPCVPKERKGSSIQMRLVRVWATITSGCGRGAKGGHHHRLRSFVCYVSKVSRFCCNIFVFLFGVKILNIILYMLRRGVYACVQIGRASCRERVCMLV